MSTFDPRQRWMLAVVLHVHWAASGKAPPAENKKVKGTHAVIVCLEERFNQSCSICRALSIEVSNQCSLPRSGCPHRRRLYLSGHNLVGVEGRLGGHAGETKREASVTTELYSGPASVLGNPLICLSSDDTGDVGTVAQQIQGIRIRFPFVTDGRPICGCNEPSGRRGMGCETSSHWSPTKSYPPATLKPSPNPPPSCPIVSH